MKSSPNYNLLQNTKRHALLCIALTNPCWYQQNGRKNQIKINIATC